LKFLNKWREKAQELKKEIHALYLASKDKRVAWPARILALIILFRLVISALLIKYLAPGIKGMQR
jgi:hypothetical protein